MYKKLGITFSIILLILIFSENCYSENINKDKNIVRVGWYVSPGFQDGQSEQSLGGYNYEYLSKLAQYTGWKYEFVYAPWKECEQMLIEGKIDLIGDIGKTEERLKKYNYSIEPNGYSRMIMVTRKNNKDIAYNDYKKFDGMKVVSIVSKYRKALLEREATRNNFDVEYIEVKTTEEIFEMLDSGQADAALLSDVIKYKNYRIISEWELKPYYFIVNKDKQEIFSKLNQGMRIMETSDKFIKERLFEKYFGDNEQNSDTAYTIKEKEFIKNNRKLNVLYDTSKFPMSYEKKGKPEGFMYRYSQIISKKIDIEFNYILCETEEETLNKLYNGEGDIVFGVEENFALSLRLNANLTRSFITEPSGLLYSPQKSYIKRVAITKTNGLDIKLLEEGYVVVKYDNMKECAEAVKDKKVDAALISAHYYEQIAYCHTYDKLTFNINNNYKTSFGIGVSKRKKPELYTIIEKSVGNIGNETKNKLLSDAIVVVPKYTLKDIIINNAWIIMLIVLFVIILLVIIGILCINAKNKTKQREMLLENNKKLDIVAKEAERANAVKTDILARMSHDMRTPMNAIIGVSELGVDERRDNMDLEYFKQIKNSGEYLLRLLNDILDMQKLESGKIEFIEELVHFGEIKKTTLEIIKNMADKKDIELICDFSKNNDFWHMMDKLRMQQALLNILSNAIKFTPKGGKVYWKEIVEKKYLKYIITDNGVGMSEEFQKHMYEPFLQEVNSETKFDRGSGLGLSITKNIIELMGGTIKCNSEVNKGTVFIIQMPIKYATKTQIDKYNKSCDCLKSQKKLNNKKILLCEDNDINIKIARKILEKEGAKVSVAEDGLKGVELAKNKKFNAILMDVRMPIMDGIIATKEIRKFDLNIPIIALSANSNEEDIEKSFSVGMNAYLAKPIDRKKLFEKLGELI